MKQNQRRICLIEPPFLRLYKDTFSLGRYPLSLAYLGETIKQKTTWDVMSYNADFHPKAETVKLSYLTGAGFNNYLNSLKDFSHSIWQQVRSTIKEYNPTVVGISAKSQTFASACIVAKLAKEINKKITVIVGGPHPSMVGSDILNSPDIDICVKGEGEKTIVELLEVIEGQRQLDSVRGIVYRKNSQAIETPSRNFIEDLDSLPFPYKNTSQLLKDYNSYPLSAFKNIFATRGCPYNCFFCGSRNIWSRKVRFRSPENVIREIKGLQKLGLKLITFDDDTFGINEEYTSRLCNAIIKHCPGLKWGCELNVKLVNEKNISIMKAAGCRYIQLGIESGNNKILRAIRKNITIEESYSACDIIRKHGIDLYAFFMVGFPQETEETLNDTVNAIKKIKATVSHYSIFTPYPGTEAFEYCKVHGLISDDYDVSLHNHQSPASYFCENIPPERFRTLLSNIEKMVEKTNSLNRIKRSFSFDTFRKIEELGVRKSLQKSIRILIGK